MPAQILQEDALAHTYTPVAQRISVRVAAAFLGLSVDYVHHLIDAGKLRAFKGARPVRRRGPATQFLLDTVDVFQLQQQRIASPPKSGRLRKVATEIA